MVSKLALYRRVGEALGRPPTAIEPYGSALIHTGQWSAGKPGRGSPPVGLMGASTLLVALMHDGPAALRDDDPVLGPPILYRARILNSVHLVRFCPPKPKEKIARPDEDVRFARARSILGIGEHPGFGETIEAVLKLWSQGRIEELVYASHMPEGFYDPDQYNGPTFEAALQGPFPIGTIRFIYADAIGGGEAIWTFLAPHFAWGVGALGPSVAGEFTDVIAEVRARSARGRKTTIGLDGRVFEAVAKLFAENPDTS